MKVIKETEDDQLIINQEKPRPKRGGGWFVFVIILVLAIGGIWWWKVGSPFNTEGAQGYKAVFLTNDQVYFGQLAGLKRQYVTLSDIFYLQVGQPLQPSEPSTNVNLIKLGGELHGPVDAMMINRDQILFIEDLKSDSQVVQAITRYKEQQNSPSQ